MATASCSTVEKALQILLALSQEQEEMGTTDLSRKLGMHKATTSRILLKLAEYGFVYKNRETGKYWLGPEIPHCSAVMAQNSYGELTETARPHMRVLRDAIGETVALEVWLGNSTILVCCEVSTRPDRITPPPGNPMPIHAAAGAKAILSFTHATRVDMLLQGVLPKLTEHTITDEAVLKQLLIEYNKQGFAIDQQEFEQGTCAIAAPIFDHFRQPIAALTVLVPASRFTAESIPAIVPKLKKKAAAIMLRSNLPAQAVG